MIFDKQRRGRLAALDDELLARLKAWPRPTTLAGLFGGNAPRWAVEAAERLEIAGRLIEDAGGVLTLIQ